MYNRINGCGESQGPRQQYLSRPGYRDSKLPFNSNTAFALCKQLLLECETVIAPYPPPPRSAPPQHFYCSHELPSTAAKTFAAAALISAAFFLSIFLSAKSRQLLFIVSRAAAP